MSVASQHLLSQIPLIHMHKAARAAGVPLLDHLLMDGQDELLKDYALERDLVACWNVYMAKAGADHQAQQAGRGVAQERIQPLAECRSREVLVREHMRLYLDAPQVVAAGVCPLKQAHGWSRRPATIRGWN
jgi:hypothetical protein